MKTYYVQYNIGRAKYVLNYHDGMKQHKDGSPFFDIMIFSNVKSLKQEVKRLENLSYVERPHQ